MGGEGKTRGSSNAESGGKARGKDVHVSIEIDFMEAINGTQKTITYARANKCGTCNGTRRKPGTNETECGVCGGSGMMAAKIGAGVFQTACTACAGQGTTFQACLTCNG